MERIWLVDSACAWSSPYATSACREGTSPSNRRLAASLPFSECQRSNSRRTSFLCVAFVAMSVLPSSRMLRHPSLIAPIRLERHRPDRPESKPPHAVGAHIGRHPGLVRVAQAHAVHGTRTPPAAQIAGVHVLRDQLVTPGQERIPRIPLLHGISERLFDLVPGEGIGVGSGRRAFLEGPIALTTSGACGLEFLGDEFVERVDGDVCVTVSHCFPSFSCGIRVSIRLRGRV